MPNSPIFGRYRARSGVAMSKEEDDMSEDRELEEEIDEESEEHVSEEIEEREEEKESETERESEIKAREREKKEVQKPSSGNKHIMPFVFEDKIVHLDTPFAKVSRDLG